jgi:hypothetical protein
MKLARAGATQVFTGRTATFVGRAADAERLGTRFPRGTPLPVSDHVAAQLAMEPDFFVTEPTYHARSAGCC